MQLISGNAVWGGIVVLAVAIVVPLAITAAALLLVAVGSLALPRTRQDHALLVLDRLVAFAAAVCGRSDATRSQIEETSVNAGAQAVAMATEVGPSPSSGPAS